MGVNKYSFNKVENRGFYVQIVIPGLGREKDEKFAIIGSQTCGFRYNRIPNICFAITTLEILTLCYYNIMVFK